MKLFLQATGKEWQKKQLQEKLKAMIKNEKASGDAKRLRDLTNLVHKTGNEPAPEPFSQTPAEDIAPGRVDPSLLSGIDPVTDKHSIVTVEPGSCFASNQEQSGVGMSRTAPRFPRFASAAATATSGLYEAQLSQAVAPPISAAQHEFDASSSELDVTNEAWAQDLFNNSGDSGSGAVRIVAIPVNTSTPARNPDASFNNSASFNNTFSTANITPIRVMSTQPRRLALTPAASGARPPAIPPATLPAILPGILPAVPPAILPAAPPAAPPAALPALPPAALPAAQPAAPPAAPPAALPAAQPGAPPAAQPGAPPAAPRQRKRRRGAAPEATPTAPSAHDALMAEKARLSRIVAADTIRLNRIEREARLEVAREEALYWRLRREALVTELLAKGADVREEYSASTAERPLNSGALAAQIHVNEGERKVCNGYAALIFCHKLILKNFLFEI
jgi:hypothetical protein